MSSRVEFASVGNAVDDAAYLESLVPVMRRLGVTAFGTVSLGADPTATTASDEPELSPNERKSQARLAEWQRLERMRFGASGGPKPVGSR